MLKFQSKCCFVWLILGMLLSTTNALSVWGANAESERPNVVLILTDDQGYGDVGFHGNKKIKTPHLDRMAKNGIELTRFYCSPVCAPTRASLMTGCYFYRTGVIHTSRGGAKMHGEEITLAELLKQAGYKTGIFGKWHLGDNYPMRPEDQGFEETLVHKSGGIGQTPDQPNSYFDSRLWKNGKRFQADGYCTDVFFDAAIKFMDQQKQARQPFFVYLPTNAPHTPLEVDRSYWGPYQKMGLNETTARVYGMVENLDENVGKLMAWLKREKLSDDTIVIFLGDNGPQQKRFTAGLRGRKSWTYEGGIRVPFVAQWPGHFQGGTKSDQIAAHIDLLPTLLSLTKTPRPASLALDGIDLSELLSGKKAELPERSLFFQVHRGLTPQQYQNSAVVTQRFKLVGYPGTFGDENLMQQAEPILELYDLSVDPGEANNLIQSKPEQAAALRQKYDAWFSAVQNTRHFTPGTIVIDKEKEDPSVLCRYQDSTYSHGGPQGWMVKINNPGLYRVQINRKAMQNSGKLIVDWQGQKTHEYLNANENTAEFELRAGTGMLDIWFQTGTDRVYTRNNNTVGDVTLKQIK